MDDFRFAAIEVSPGARADRFSAWHWHEDVELAYVVEGQVDGHAPGKEWTLSAGEGCFVNAGTLRMYRPTPGMQPVKLRILRFDPEWLSGMRSIHERFVRPIKGDVGLDGLPFRPNHAACKAILDDMAGVFDIAADEPPAFELDILQMLLRIWKEMFLILDGQLHDDGFIHDTAVVRAKALLDYIHSHYGSPMSVAETAEAVDISEREAFRVFRQVLNTTPTLYIQHYRLFVAARLLAESDRPIADISLATGFSRPSYFGKAFRDLTGLSPREFRRLRRV